MSTITPRKLELDFGPVPRAWMGGSAVGTAIANGVNILFPIGERFFVRSVKQFADAIPDPELRADVKGFFGQEGRHAQAHDRFNAVLRDQGFAIDDFLATFERTLRAAEARFPAKLALATTAACEHFTAIMAEGALTKGMLDTADPRMRMLLAWHAAEEIEHKAVAFDVLQRVDPSYALRIAGLVVATGFLGVFWARATRMLLAQQGYSLRAALAELRALPREEPIIKGVFARGIREYLRRGFHPNDHDQSRLAEAWFAARGLAMPAAA